MDFLRKYRNHIYLHLIVFIWGFTGVLGKLISISAVPLVWYRMGIAFLGLLLFLIITKQMMKVTWSNFFALVFIGFLIALHWIFFFEAIKVSNVSIALVCISSTSLFTAFLEPLFFRTRIVVYEVIFGIVVIFGLYLIFQFESKYIWGIVYSVLAAFLSAFFTVINAKWIKEQSSKTMAFYEMLGGFIGISLYFLSLGHVFEVPSWQDIFYLLILGLICTSLAFALSIEIMKEISPFTVAISVNMEPIYAILLAIIIFGKEEQMTLGFYLGAVLIIGTIFVNAFLKRKKSMD